MRIYLCLLACFLTVGSSLGAPIWVENNCTLERNTLTFIAGNHQKNPKKICYWKTDNPDEDTHLQRNTAESHTHEDFYSHHLDAALLLLSSRSFSPSEWVIESTFQYRFSYQSIDRSLVSPPPQG